MATPGDAELIAAPPPPEYPQRWEADVALRDGGICHIRPIGPKDEDRLRRFHRRLSPRTVYYRFFTPYPELSDRDVKRFTHVDHDARVALVATVGDEILGVGRYDRVGDQEAEVAFTVRDDHQGRGLGSVLLEHLAAAARERGVQRFIAEVLPGNRAMLSTFAMAGYKVAQELDEGVVRLAFDIEPTQTQRDVARARELRAEARSVERLFQPRSVIIIGASRRPESIGHGILRALAGSGFTGRLAAVHPLADEVAGVPAFRRVSQAPGPIDLAIVVVPADAVDRVVADCAEAGVHGLLVVSSGFAEAGEAGQALQRELVATVRAHGMRLVGPNALGIINTDSRVRLTAALVREAPLRGRVGLFCHSASIGLAVLERMRQRRMGVSSFISVGNHADISSPDALHYWSGDPSTKVVGMYLESIGNPRKFVRVARDVGRRTSVVALRTGQSSQAFPLGPRLRRSTIPAAAVQDLFSQAGVISAESLDQLLDICGMLACQPLPRGRRVAVVSDSSHLAVLATDVAAALGLESAREPVLVPDAHRVQLEGQLIEVTRDPGVDAVLAIVVPPTPEDVGDSQRALLRASHRSTVPVLGVVSAEGGNRVLVAPGTGEAAGPGSVPLFGTVEEALRALSRVVQHAAWRSAPRGEVPELPDVDTEGARALVERSISRRHGRAAPEQTIRLPSPAVAELLENYGVRLWPAIPVAGEDEAVAAADEVGWPVVLKTADPRLSRRIEMGGVRLHLESEAALRAAFLSMSAHLDGRAMAQLVVQRMAPPGVPCTIASIEDPLFGPVVSFGLGGVVGELLGDRAYRVPPVSDLDARALVRAPGAARLLFGHAGNPPVDTAAVEDLIMRVGRMADDLPQLVRLELNPVIASARGAVVLGASAWLRPAEVRLDSEARRLGEV